MKHLLASVMPSVPYTLYTCKLDRCAKRLVLHKLTQQQQMEPSAVDAQRSQSARRRMHHAQFIAALVQ